MPENNNSYLIDLKKIKTELRLTLCLGLTIGLIGLFGYTYYTYNVWKIFYVLLLLACACFISGFFLGIIFSIPKRNKDDKAQYELNNNLVEISDWLTKIIIGLGLIELKSISHKLIIAGEYIQVSLNGDPSLKVFSICCIIFFGVFGLYYGYNYMKLILSGHYKITEDNLSAKRDDVLKSADISNIAQIDVKTPTAVKNKLREFISELGNTKTESEYSFEDWFIKGVNAFDNGTYELAIGYLQKALALNNKHEKVPDAYLLIGLSYQNLELLEKAIDTYDKILAVYSDYDNKDLIYYNKGVALDDLKKFDEAMQEYDKALKIDPCYADVWYNKAAIYAKENKKDNMMESLKKAIENDDECKPYAKTDDDFKNFWNDPDFKKLIS